MTSWTLRGSNPRFEHRQQQDHPAARRAQRYVRRHAWQFHGAGVRDAVPDMPTSPLLALTDAVRNVRVGLAKFSEALNKPITNDTVVVGWRSPSGLLLCLKHPHLEAVPVTADDLPGDGLCAVCRTELTP